MGQQHLDFGTAAANDGEFLYTAFPKIEGNFNEVYASLAGLIIGSTIQAWDADLQAIATLTPVDDDILQRKAGAWTNRTLTQIAADLDPFFLTPAEVAAAFQPLDSDLTAVAALSATGLAARTAANTWAARTITGTAGKIDVTNGDGVAGNPTITLPSAITIATSITDPLLIGGTAAGSTLTLQSTSGVGTTDAITFKVGNNGAVEGGRFVTAGEFILGHTAALTIQGVVPKLQVHGTGSLSRHVSNHRWSADANASFIFLGKSRGASVGTHTVVQNNDNLGTVAFNGSDGTNFIVGASIFARVDSIGTPGTNSMPAGLIFATTADGASSETNRLSINSKGFIKVLTGSFGRGAPVTKTVDFTVADSENNLINNKSGSACTVTLPSASEFSGRDILIKTIQAQAVNSASSNVIPLAGGAAGTAILTGTAGKWAILVSNGTNWEIMAAA